MLTAGDRNKRVAIYNVTYTNVSGERTQVLTLYATRWANVKATGGREQQVAKNFTGTVDYVFNFLFDKGIVPTQVLVWEGKFAAINAVYDKDGRRKELNVLATQTVNDQTVLPTS